MSNDPGEANAVGGRAYGPVGGSASFGVNLPTQEVNAFNTAMAGLTQTLNRFSQQASGYAASFGKLNSAVGGAGGGNTVSGGVNTGLMGSMFGSANERGWMQDMLMFPTRFMRSAVTDNRNLALMASAGLGQQAFGAGASTTKMMGALAGQFGNILGGSPADLVNLMNVAGQVGAGVNWQGVNAQGPPSGVWGGGGGPRMAGFMRSVFEAQRMTPGADVGSLAGMIGNQVGNVGSQQQSAFLTGGAFSMIGPGNQQRSISEWSEGILKWLQNLRPGSDRGKPFSYGELMSQNFPGSNIDAWLTANGVNQDMKGYFWSYAMARAGQRPGGRADELFSGTAVTSSVAFNKLRASAATTSTGFQLAGTMGGAYANKEQANQFFNELMGFLQNQVIPSAMSAGPMAAMQFMPDTFEEILMQLAERTGLGALGAGAIGWGSGIMQAGDVGDVGDYGPMGGTTSAGLHPDMRKRVDGMMSANPRLRVTSGFRDLGTQQRLKRKGVGRVSGRPSAHTRGMAADLGPSSEYGWIARNAGRFGLKTGRSQGEPWHVGMGDVGDINDIIAGAGAQSAMTGLANAQLGTGFAGIFKDIFGGIFGAASDPANQIKAIGGGSSLLLQMLMGIFSGSGGTDYGRLVQRDVYNDLVSAANSARFPLGGGLPTGTTGGWIDRLLNGGLGGGPPTDFGGGEFPSSSVWSSPDNITRGAAVVKLLKAAGFHGDELTRMAAISWHESGWRPSAWVSDSDDIGGGLYAINQKPWLDRGMTPKYSREEIQDPVRSTQIAREYYMDRGYQPWTTRNKSLDMGIQAREAAGVGDISYDSMADYGIAAPSSGRPVVFQNTFKIDGGGNGGGLDVRRTVTLLADQLEAEMKQRMARSN